MIGDESLYRDLKARLAGSGIAVAAGASGLIEAAQMALDIAPGLGRHFGFERLRIFDRALWARLRGEAEARCQPARLLPILGADIDLDQVKRSQQNLDAAGLGECVELRRCDMLELAAPAASGVLVTNPPYGVRLAHRIPRRTLELCFAAFLGSISVRFLIDLLL